MLTIPAETTSVESRAVHEAGIGAGGREVYLIEQPLAAAPDLVLIFLYHPHLGIWSSL